MDVLVLLTVSGQNAQFEGDRRIRKLVLETTYLVRRLTKFGY